jgi:uncharacterized RDD family membrane protein YckC
MRKIDITTTQNVTIEYELATVQERAISTFLDTVIISLGSLILFGVISAILPYGNDFQYYFVLVPGSFFYHLLFESLNHGQTPGKKIMKLRVVKITGERPEFFDFMMRTVFRFIDLTASLGSMAIILVSSSSKGQRLGDFFADTTVVRLININTFSLNRILSMEKLKQHTPQYPDVVKFTEEEMMLIKETIDRYKKYPNDRATWNSCP